MEMYFLKSAACLAVLLFFYKLLLERENMHVFKRFYLLTSIVAAIAIPAITFTTYIEPSSEIIKQVLISSEATSVITTANYWPYVLTGIYILGVLFFSIKFFRNLRNLILKIRKNEKIRENEFTKVLLSENTPPHTFFHYIFFNKQKYLRNEISQDVRVHEEAHARQKHSLDVIFVELLQIIFWFNPLIFLLKNAIKLNHEFLADRAVLKQGYSTVGYQQTLLSYSSKDLQSDLVNPINYSSIKKRFTVMKTQTSKNAIWARGFLILPLISFLFFSFSNKEIIEKEMNPLTTETSNSTTLIIEVDQRGKIFFKKAEVEIADLRNFLSNGSYTSYHIEVAENSSPPIMKNIIQLMAEYRLKGSVATCTITETAQDKATPEMVAEYNRLVKHYNSIPKEDFSMTQEHANRIMAILGKMSTEQKGKAEKIKFKVLPPPPPPPAPAPESIPGSEKIPPPPPPPTYEDLVERGAIFYHNDKWITPEEALRLVRVVKNVTIEINNTGEKPRVMLRDKN